MQLAQPPGRKRRREEQGEQVQLDTAQQELLLAMTQTTPNMKWLDMIAPASLQ